ncbi:MAG: alpha/beta hydrolase [Deltaproteobacteria bacterium]|nr:alpha/beta hydrolase [Deltaproteobacteria bacterium]
MSSIFDRDDFNRALFFPRADRSPAPPDATDMFVGVGGANVHVRMHAAVPGTRCTLLLFHGNGEVVADYDAGARMFAAAGGALAVADYRGYGASEGAPTLRDLIADARPIAAAVAAARPGPMVVMGRSLGGAAAHELYARPLPQMVGVVLESAFFDLAGLIGRRGLPPPRTHAPADLATFDPATKLALGRLPLLVLHGALDSLILHDEAEAALAAAGSADKRLVTIPERGHNDVSGEPTYWAALGTFLQRLT